MPESVERARLIPILTTILKLSKEEVERVQSVVTGINYCSYNVNNMYDDFKAML